MTAANNTLMPCPFCANKPTFGYTKKTGCQMHGDPIQYVTLGCRKCEFKPSITGGCRYRGADIPKYENEARAEAISKWNTRAPTEAQHDDAGVKEALERAIEELTNGEPHLTATHLTTIIRVLRAATATKQPKGIVIEEGSQAARQLRAIKAIDAVKQSNSLTDCESIMILDGNNPLANTDAKPAEKLRALIDHYISLKGDAEKLAGALREIDDILDQQGFLNTSGSRLVIKEAIAAFEKQKGGV